jgi:hypothetical protein
VPEHGKQKEHNSSDEGGCLDGSTERNLQLRNVLHREHAQQNKQNAGNGEDRLSTMFQE